MQSTSTSSATTAYGATPEQVLEKKASRLLESFRIPIKNELGPGRKSAEETKPRMWNHLENSLKMGHSNASNLRSVLESTKIKLFEMIDKEDAAMKADKAAKAK